MSPHDDIVNFLHMLDHSREAVEMLRDDLRQVDSDPRASMAGARVDQTRLSKDIGSLVAKKEGRRERSERDRALRARRPVLVTDIA